jgi:transcriptional regulator with XRE-family HTH domain
VASILKDGFFAYADMHMNAESERLAAEFAARLREAIDDPEFGLPPAMSLAQKAKALGLSGKSLLSKWLLAGTASPDYRMIKAACTRLQIRPEWLCANDGPKRHDQNSKGAIPPLIRGAASMKLKQQQEFIVELLENVPHTFRSEWIDSMTRAAIDLGYITRWPDVMIADRLADQTLEVAKRRKEHPTRSESE